MKLSLGTFLILGLMFGGAVHAAPQNGGLAASFVQPTGDFKNVVGSGYGLSAIFDYPLASVVNLSGALGRYHFTGVDERDGMSFWEFTAGPQVDFGKLYGGIEVGYYTTLKEWGVVPNLGIRKGMVDVGLRFKVTADRKYFALRAGIFF